MNSESKLSMPQESANLQPLLAPWLSKTRHVSTNGLSIRECPLRECLPRYSRTVQNKEMSLYVRSYHRFSLDVGPLPNHSCPQLAQNYHISIYITFPLLKGDTVWNFLTRIFLHGRLFYLPEIKTVPLHAPQKGQKVTNYLLSKCWDPFIFTIEFLFLK